MRACSEKEPRKSRQSVSRAGKENHLSGLDLADIFQEERRAECLSLVTAYLEHQTLTSERKTKEDAGIKRPTPFHNKCQPRISLTDYVHRLAKFTNASSPCFIMACAYTDRLCKVNELYRVSKQTAHRLLLCGVLLAAKLSDDKFRSNAYFSKVGGVSKAALNDMELHMFTKLDYSLFLSETALAQQLLLMCSEVGPEVLNSKLMADSGLRRSKKRISEDVGFSSEDDLPAKLPHGEQYDAVIVVGEKDEGQNLSSAIEASDLLSAVENVVSREASRQSSISSCAQEFLASERPSNLKTSTVSPLPGP